MSLHGFLNYFGPQRFGLDDKEVNACDVGLAMLQGDVARKFCNFTVCFKSLQVIRVVQELKSKCGLTKILKKSNCVL